MEALYEKGLFFDNPFARIAEKAEREMEKYGDEEAEFDDALRDAR